MCLWNLRTGAFPVDIITPSWMTKTCVIYGNEVVVVRVSLTVTLKVVSAISGDISSDIVLAVIRDRLTYLMWQLTAILICIFKGCNKTSEANS